MIRVKTIWNASGNRHAMLPERKENPKVSQLESEKPEIQLACKYSLVERIPRRACRMPNHLDYNELSSAAHLAGFGLPYTGSCCIHPFTRKKCQQISSMIPT